MLTAHSSQLTAHSSQLTAHSSQLTAHSSQLTAHSSQLTAINCHQKELYESYEANSIQYYMNSYEAVLSKYKSNKQINILDIGGASGNFALAVKNYFGASASVYVIDTTSYDTWEQETYSRNITFIKDSIENLKSCFPDEMRFDLIFANRVFHHFVSSSWEKTLDGMNDYLSMIHDRLSPEGSFCIHDHFYNGYVCDAASSYVIYKITSCRIPFVASIAKRFGARSAGVGVCFQSERMWLKRLRENGFANITLNRTVYKHLRGIKRIILMNREYSLDNMIICRK